MLLTRKCKADNILCYRELSKEGYLKARVLVVDESPFIRKLMGDIFRRAEYEVCGEANSISRAVELYKELKPDLVTLGMVLADVNGLDGIKTLLKTDEEAKVVVVTALGRDSLLNASHKLGAKAFVVKPFRPSRILEAAKKVLAV
jgi:two-component system chemotaxis response regulator CheY